MKIIILTLTLLPLVSLLLLITGCFILDKTMSDEKRKKVYEWLDNI